MAVRQTTFDAWSRDPAVEILGYRTDIAELLTKASIAVLPSNYREGVPKFLIEAAACGRAIITTDRPGCRDTVVPGQSGILIPPGDVDALVAAIKMLVADPARLDDMGRRGRALAQEVFGIDAVVSKHLKIFESLLRRV